MTAAESWWEWFPADYDDARGRFTAAAQNAGAALSRYVHPEARGPQGQPLQVDVARLGPPDASRVLLAISGTHGLEAPAGAAVQLAWLATASATLPPDLAVVLVHAINPYGFAHQTRTTEHNVDLNRNFVAHDAPYPANADYEALYPHLVAQEWTAAARLRAADAFAAYAQAHGDDALFNARARGQYRYADGPAFGGQARAWSNLVLEQIVHAHTGAARQVGLIDWHTGLGDYAEPFFLCFSPAESAEFAQAAQWWGRGQIENARPNGLARPSYQGILVDGVRQFLHGKPLVAAVIEFGTRPSKTGEAVQLDQWLRFKAPLAPDAHRDAQLRADLNDAFVPVASVWRRAVIHHGLRITQQAIDGLHAWQA